MKIIRRAQATWQGPVPTGSGAMRLGRSADTIPFSLRSRTEDGAGTNPEEMLGAAHAGCFSMSLSNLLEEAGHPVTEIVTDAKVTMGEVDGSFTITNVDLVTRGTVDGVDEATFQELAKQACPVSKLFAGAEISVAASLA